MKRPTSVIVVFAMVGALMPVRLGATPVVTTGGIRGAVIENTGRPVGTALQVQLVNSRGVAVSGKTAAVSTDGAFTFLNVDPGTYTVRVLGASGSTAVTVMAGRVSTANVTVAKAQAGGAGMSTTAKWVIALAAAGGGTAVAVYVATKDDASGSK